jgi:molecular chaperone DnaK
MAAGGIDKINQATSKLETASHKLAEAMYKSASQTAGTPPQGGAAPDADSKPKDGKKDDVVDAEFVDVEDKK